MCHKNKKMALRSGDAPQPYLVVPFRAALENVNGQAGRAFGATLMPLCRLTPKQAHARRLL
ncbi:hypothetical protein MPC4_100060 [Methylocella tundrae]|uniref:Uncharacterized protein n=1 Tax=Methylocella tundrae TaxID=227605 RepID=A0A8B6M0Q0_METTU|nr:hypothetical protein MPC1_4790003 [Methylocella tundrae]VTZ48617.1 hypothetical protein MPC4_100060 [Methylocella tundrae]